MERLQKNNDEKRNGLAELVHAYENRNFPAKYFARTCASCSYFGICDAANTESWL